MPDTKTDTKSSTAVADNQGLEKASDVKVPEVITTPAQFSAGLQMWTDRFNVLSPFTAISGIAPQHGIVRSAVQMDLRAQYAGETTEHGGDLYGGAPWLKGGKRGEDGEVLALSKGGLRKLAECAGISIRTERTDPYTIPHYWSVRAIASYRGIDGAIVTREATMEWDLRDGSERMNGWTANQVKENRKNGLRNCESRAINAAIRECGCGLKQSYTRRELRKPFLVFRVAFQPDMTDPEQRRLVAEAGLRSTSTLYGAPAPALPAGAHPVGDFVDDTPTPRHVGSGTTQPVEGAVRIAEVTPKAGTNQKTGRPWKRFDVTDHHGEVSSTFDTKIAEAAMKARDEKAWVELSIEQNGSYRNLLEIIPAGSEPKLPSMEQL